MSRDPGREDPALVSRYRRKGALLDLDGFSLLLEYWSNVGVLESIGRAGYDTIEGAFLDAWDLPPVETPGRAGLENPAYRAIDGPDGGRILINT